MNTKELDELQEKADEAGVVAPNYYDAAPLFRKLAAAIRELRGSGEPVAWRCQLIKGGDWFYFLTNPDLADDSPWDSIVALNREELQQEIVALVKDRKSLSAMATLLAEARRKHRPQSGVVVPEEPTEEMLQAAWDILASPQGEAVVLIYKAMLASRPAQGAQNAAGQEKVNTAVASGAHESRCQPVPAAPTQDALDAKSKELERELVALREQLEAEKEKRRLIEAQHARLCDEVYEEDGETLKIVAERKAREEADLRFDEAQQRYCHASIELTAMADRAEQAEAELAAERKAREEQSEVKRWLDAFKDSDSARAIYSMSTEYLELRQQMQDAHIELEAAEADARELWNVFAEVRKFSGVQHSVVEKHRAKYGGEK